MLLINAFFEFLRAHEVLERGDAICDPAGDILSDGEIDGLVVLVDSILQDFLLKRIFKPFFSDGRVKSHIRELRRVLNLQDRAISNVKLFSFSDIFCRIRI